MTEPSLSKRLSSAVEAWRALKNPRPIDKIPMAVQWQGSDIKLTKTSEFIEIITPPQGVGFGLIALFSIWIAANIRLLLEFVEGGTYPLLNIVSVICLVTVLAMFLCALFRELRLRIDRQQISYRFHLLGLKWNHSKPVPRQDICQLEIEEIGYKVFQVIIQTGNQEYRLGKKQGLSKSEIEWLATELSQWLGLKIKTTLTDKVDE